MNGDEGDMPIQAGQTLSHYRLIEKIGEGGMGQVWKAQDTRLQRHVALKFVLDEATRNPQQVDRHIREARAASAMNHPHICSIHDIGEWEGIRFLVMELMEGQSLQQHIGNKPLQIEVAVEFTLQIADALETAHDNGIIHRDIKTANIFVTDRGQAKVLDFGLAKLAPDSGPLPAPGDQTMTALELTNPGAVVGTVSYMSPRAGSREGPGSSNRHLFSGCGSLRDDHRKACIQRQYIRRHVRCDPQPGAHGPGGTQP